VSVQGGEYINLNVHSRFRLVIDWLLQFEVYMGVMVLFVGHLATHDTVYSVMPNLKMLGRHVPPRASNRGIHFPSKPPPYFHYYYHSYTTPTLLSSITRPDAAPSVTDNTVISFICDLSHLLLCLSSKVCTIHSVRSGLD
jgi:hypothetical protein